MGVKGTVPWRVRAKAQKDSCETCGSTSQLGLHHRDEDRTNNSLENLETLCQSCHTTWHWRNGKAGWRRHPPTCTVCGEPAKRSGLCETHRTRLRRYGSPYLVRRRSGSGWRLFVDLGPLSGREPDG